MQSYEIYKQPVHIKIFIFSSGYVLIFDKSSDIMSNKGRLIYMIRIAIADDEKYICEQIKQYILNYSIKYNYEFETETFGSCEALIQNYIQGNKFDIIFLDVDFSNLSDTSMSGIEFGKNIRKLFKNDNTAIVYITSYAEYAIDSIKVRPFDYLKKPITYEMITEIMNVYIKQYTTDSKIFKFISSKVENSVIVSNIRFFESQGRTIIIHTIHNKYRFYGKLSEIIQLECFQNFICIHKSYFVNMNYIEKFTSNKVILFGINSEELPISKNKQTEVSERLLRR